MTKKLPALLMFTVLSAAAFCQNVTYYKYAVEYRDKEGTPYSLSSPSDFLSEKAIQRREKQKIEIGEHDLPVNPAYISGVLSAGQDIEYYGSSRWLNFSVIGMSDTAAMTAVRQLPYVKSVKRIYQGKELVKMITKPTKKDVVAKEWGMQYESLPYGGSSNQVTMLGLDVLHRRGHLGEGVVIAVLDAGFQNVNNIQAFNHIRDENRFLGTWDFVTNDTSVYEDHSHGTNVLSCIAAYIPGQIVGTAPKASFWLLRSEDAASETISEEYNWVLAAEFADSVGADIINSSLGYTTFDDPADNHTYAQMDGNTTVITRGADFAAACGILVVNSAGNSGNGAWHYIGAPADGDSVLAIGAVDKDKMKASFSSFGPSYDGRVKPNVCAQGQATVVVVPSGAPSTSNGTSFSSPVMAGAAACLWQMHPAKTNMEIKQAIEQSAHLYNAPNDELGYGIPNFGVADMLLNKLNLDHYYENQEIKVYPNPVSDNLFYVDYYSPEEATLLIQITNMRGKIIFNTEIKVQGKSYYQFPLEVEKKMSAGVYILSLRDSMRTFTSKFVKS